jgi:hypothetical protein
MHVTWKAWRHCPNVMAPSGPNWPWHKEQLLSMNSGTGSRVRVNYHFVLLQEMWGEYIMQHPPFLYLQCSIDLPEPIFRVMVCTFQHLVDVIPSCALRGSAYELWTNNLESLQQSVHGIGLLNRCSCNFSKYPPHGTHHVSPVAESMDPA